MRLVSNIAEGPDPDADAYILAVEAASGLPLEDPVKEAINAFVVGCKADASPNSGVSNWDAIKQANFLCAAPNLAGALVPLKGVAVGNNNFVDADYSRALGLQGDGTSKFIDTNRPGSSDPQNNCGYGVYMTTPELLTGNRVLLGNKDAVGSAVGSSLLLFQTGPILFRAKCATTASVPAQNTVIGYKGTYRASSGTFFYRTDGVSTSASVTSDGNLVNDIHIFARQGVDFSSVRLSFYHAGEAVNLGNLDSRLTTFMSSISSL